MSVFNKDFIIDLLSSIGVGAVWLDPKGGVESLNEAAKVILGIDGKIVSLKNLDDFNRVINNGEAVIEQIHRHVLKSVESNQTVSCTERGLVLSDKRKIDVNYHIYPYSLSNNGKKADRAVILLREIKKDSLIKKNSSSYEKEFKPTFDETNDGMMVIDRNLKIVICNKAMLKIFNVEFEDIIGMHCYDVCYGYKKTCDDCTAYEVLSSGKTISRTRPYIESKGKKKKLLEIWNFPMYNADGEPQQIIEYVKDVSGKDSLHEELTQSKRLALIGEMAARAAHEVRNPLNAIEGAAHFLHNEFKDTPVIQQYSQLIKDQVSRLNNVTNDLLDLAKPTRHNMPEINKCNIETVIHNSVESLKDRFKKNGIFVTFVVCSATPQIMADANLLTQMLINLFINASDAMPEGGDLMISSNVHIDAQSKRRFLNIRIKDTGSGFDSKNTGNLYKPFYTTKPKGTGLGLSIVQKIVQNHNGSIDIESKLNEGTTVDIKLPVLIS